MSPKTPDFERYMLIGLGSRRDGKHLEASNEFWNALSIAQTDEQRSIASQAQGIDLRLAGWLNEAEEAFEMAMTFNQGNPQHLGTILRDYAMVKIDQGKFSEAREMLRQAILELPWADDPLEFAVTMGFLARSYWLDGQREDALTYYASAYQDIRGKNDIYEVNFLIWWMKALGPFGRFRRSLRAIRLAHKTGHNERMVEAVLITLAGPRMTEKVKRLKQR